MRALRWTDDYLQYNRSRRVAQGQTAPLDQTTTDEPWLEADARRQDTTLLAVFNAFVIHFFFL